jgi:hypothetical protein
MKPAINEPSARQDTGGPSPVLGRRGNGNDCGGRQHLTKVEVEIAELTERPTHDLRLAWRRLHRIDPPLGLSRDLLIRALAHQLQERIHGGARPALRRRLQNLTAGSHKAGVPRDPGIALKTGTRLVRHWRGHAHTILVREDGFEYEGERYRSLTVIAKRITGAHWSGPRFFGLIKRAGAAVSAEAGR